MDWPSLSVIIPSFNQGDYIERTILSILKQDYQGKLQVIVSDGGSKDQTVDILKKYPQITWWSKPDKGFVDAVNRGLNVSTGEIIAIQSSDDYYLRDAFKISMLSLLKDDISIVAGCDVLLNYDQKTFSLSNLDSYYIDTPKSLFYDRYIPQHCAFFKRDILNKIGGLREEVDTCADTDLWYRALHYFRGKFIPNYTAVYQFQPNQRTKVLKSFSSCHKKMIETCEQNIFYKNKFLFTEEEKREIYLGMEIGHELKYGNKNKAIDLIKEILNSDKIGYKTKEQFATLIKAKNELLLYKLIHSIANGTIAGKINKQIRRQILKRSIDLYWWRA